MAELNAASLNIGIIGAGNVATHLAKGFWEAGATISFLYSRTEAHAAALAQQVQAAAVTSLDFTKAPLADVYFLAIPDQALPGVAAQAKFPPNAVVVHTSGAQPLSVLSALTEVRKGVFYPLQTFSKEKPVEWAQIPICIEAEQPEVQELLQRLGFLLSQRIELLHGDARKQLHVAAVFACNFTNHLWGVAQELLQKAQLPVQLLEPLIRETVEKAFQFPPFAVQTGPAQRHDTSTLQAHNLLLQDTPQYQQLYQVLTASIQATAENRLLSAKEGKNAG